MVAIDFSLLKGTKPHEYAVRFLFGGLCTVIAGIIATRFGPGIGGLFLAFPAIFPAGATLIESHEKQRKARVNSDGTNRGRTAASIDAAGAALGSIGLVAFAVVLWKSLVSHNASEVITIATLVWLSVAFGLWKLRKRRVFRQPMRSR